MSITLRFYNRVDNVLTDVTSVVLSDPTGTYGVKRDDTDAVVVADGTAMTKFDTGIYEYTFTKPAAGLSYTWYAEWVYSGVTRRVEFNETDVVDSEDYDQRGGIRTRWRTATGISDTDEVSDAEINARTNDFYKGEFIREIHHDSLDTDFTQAVTVDDDGEYSLASTVLEVNGRLTFNNEELTQYFDKDTFFREFPNQEEYVTDPTLVIGTSSAAAVKNSSFKYEITNWTYTKASAETALSGDTVPQSKYGAWVLSIDADGTITVTGASDNATGYTTAALAVNGLSTPTDAVMGFVTAINTSATFVPGTTDLNASGVTATFTDGNPALRQTPSSFLTDGRKLYIRPKSDDDGQIKARLQITLPTELSQDTSTVFDEMWGQAIAVGDASKYMLETGDTKKAQELDAAYKRLISSINTDWYIQRSKQPAQRAY